MLLNFIHNKNYILKLRIKLLFIFSFGFNLLIFSQVKIDEGVVVQGTIDSTNIDLLRKSPAKASLYSAILPGLGQWYNGKKIKAPIVLGIVGAGIGYTLYLDNRYNRLKTAFIKSLNGETHEYSYNPNLTTTSLGNAQDRAKRNRDYMIAISSLLYILNIVDAVVDAHLSEFKVDKDLAITPTILTNPSNEMEVYSGIGISFKF